MSRSISVSVPALLLVEPVVLPSSGFTTLVLLPPVDGVTVPVVVPVVTVVLLSLTSPVLLSTIVVVVVPSPLSCLIVVVSPLLFAVVLLSITTFSPVAGTSLPLTIGLPPFAVSSTFVVVPSGLTGLVVMSLTSPVLTSIVVVVVVFGSHQRLQ
ncbi:MULTISPECIES: hypothetical protein [Amylolactobacillus]|uniref:hypothetical protein n=1 Tax=Amylolactobacillus TaxID=2767876 RepID=UPI0011449444|nr:MULTISPECIES: hypothetical protein [Amylolactobacillus]